MMEDDELVKEYFPDKIWQKLDAAESTPSRILLLNEKSGKYTQSMLNFQKGVEVANIATDIQIERMLQMGRGMPDLEPAAAEAATDDDGVIAGIIKP